MKPRQALPIVTVPIAVIMLFQVCALFLRELARRFLIEAGRSPEVAAYQSAWFGFAVVIILLSAYWRQQRPFILGLFRRPASWTALLLVSIAIGICMRIASWGIALIVAALPGNYLHGEWVFMDAGVQWQCPDVGFLMLGLATMAMATPLIEEIINRGLLLRRLDRVSTRFPILTSAVLFAILHRPGGMIAALLFGIVVAYQMRHCQMILGPIISHATSNALGTFDRYCLTFGNLEVALLSLGPALLSTFGVIIVTLSFWTGIALARLPDTGAR